MQDVSVLPLWRCLERRGGPDLYVTEYFRVHRDSHPEKEILRSIEQMAPAKPVVAQMIGNEPEHLVRTAREIEDRVPCVGIDVNLGCPAPKVCGKAAGGALLRNPALIRRIAGSLRPVVKGTLTLKTRVGFESADEFDDLLDLFASLPIDGLAVHGRTVREKYQSPVHTDRIAESVRRLPFPVTANGSVVSVRTARAMAQTTGAAGLMIGRGAIRNPWLFRQIRESFAGTEAFRPTLADLRDYLAELMDELATEGDFPGESQLVNRMKKFANYAAIGLAEGALGRALRRAATPTEFLGLCDEFLSSDEPVPEEPEEDGKLFCGTRELAAAGA